jgi:hypothetical protein
MQPNRDPDANIIVVFKNSSVKNDARSAAAGRPIHDDREEVELRYPGSKNVSVFPATAVSHWVTDPVTGEQLQISYAERFSRQYQQFRAHGTQTKFGTPLSDVGFLTEARRAELRALNVYTVEALAAVDGQELKNLGTNGRELKNKAMEYIEDARRGAPNTQMAADLEALKARNTLLEEDMRRLREQMRDDGDDAGDVSDFNFEEMSLDQLREFIEKNTGHAPHGTPNRRTLIRMARDCSKVSA